MLGCRAGQSADVVTVPIFTTKNQMKTQSDDNLVSEYGIRVNDKLYIYELYR